MCSTEAAVLASKSYSFGKQLTGNIGIVTVFCSFTQQKYNCLIHTGQDSRANFTNTLQTFHSGSPVSDH